MYHNHVLVGNKQGKYKQVELTSLVGKQVEAVGYGTVEGAWGLEPCTILYFTDKTFHGFVHARDGD